MQLDFTEALSLHYSKFFLEWPWIGLGACVVILILAFATDFLRVDKGRGRWHDPAWLAWLGAVAYMLHNVEEYGVAANGMFNAFPTYMYAALGFQVGEPAYLGCNLCLMWVMGPAAAVLARKRRGTAFCMSVFELINAVTHVVQAVSFRMYNPGLVTAVVAFVPLCVWTLHVCFGRDCRMPRRVLWGQLGMAALYHVLLFAGIFAARAGLIGNAVQGLWMVADAAVTFAGWCLVARCCDGGIAAGGGC